MRMPRLVPLLCLAFVGCAGDDDSGTSSGVSTTAITTAATDSASTAATSGSGGATTGAGTSGSGTTGGGSSGGGGTISSCFPTCASAQDCASASLPFDADNYTCLDGLCRYDGCNSDAECESLGAYACAASQGAAAYCQPTCQAVADCVVAAPDYDADNYACEGGVCRYTGCTGDAECAQKGAYVCRDTAALLLPGLDGVPTCVVACQAAADCAMPSAGAAFDADNYACIEGGCVWTGCNSTAECTMGQVCGTTNG